MLPLTAFVDALVAGGPLSLPGPTELFLEADVAALGDQLLAIDAARRLDAPASAPELDLDAAVWAAKVFFRACQVTVYRDVDQSAVDHLLGADEQAVPRAASPSAHWSVDLVLRYLPDLHRLAAGLSPGDPLLTHMLRWAGDWPLSSVGVKGEFNYSSDTIIADPCLGTLYVERIVTRRDWARLADPHVRARVHAAFGAFDPWPTELAAALSKAEELHAN